MVDNQLLKLLSSFSRKEMTRFTEFCRSPYFNKHQDVLALVEELNRCYPVFDEKNCQREVLFQRLYPGQPHDQPQLALLFTYTLRLSDHFLSQEQLKNSPNDQTILLLQQIRQRKQFKYYEKKIKKLESQLTNSPHRDSHFYRLQFLKAAEADAYYTQLSKREKDLNIQRKQDNLDHYYLSEKLRDACEMLLRSRILKIQYSTGWLDKILEEVTHNLEAYQDVPAILVYYHLYQLIRDEQNDQYKAIIPLVQYYADQFKQPELQNIYNYLQNHCIKQINKGSLQFLREAFELYKIQLEQALLLNDKGFLAEWHYKNIVTIGLRLREVEWIRLFLDQYRESLQPNIRENAYNYNLAAYHYAVKDYDQVLALLLAVEYTDTWYNLDSKSLLLRTYYDLDEYDAFLSLQQSFKQLIRRNKLISEFQRKGYEHLLRFTNRAFKIKSQFKLKQNAYLRKQVKKLITELAQANPVHNRSWLDSRIESIEHQIRK